MNKLTNLTISAVLVSFLFAGVLFFSRDEQPLGSVATGDAYQYKNITITDASSTAAVSIPVKGGSGTLGSVVINTTNSSSTVIIYDNTSGTDNPIAKFPVSAGAGTYTFDVAVRNGISIIPTIGFNGNWTITYR